MNQVKETRDLDVSYFATRRYLQSQRHQQQLNINEKNIPSSTTPIAPIEYEPSLSHISEAERIIYKASKLHILDKIVAVFLIAMGAAVIYFTEIISWYPLLIVVGILEWFNMDRNFRFKYS